MPVVQDPSKLTYIVETPVGELTLTAAGNRAFNRFQAAWHTLSVQTLGVANQRLNRATWYRARYDDVVKL